MIPSRLSSNLRKMQGAVQIPAESFGDMGKVRMLGGMGCFCGFSWVFGGGFSACVSIV